MIEKLFLNGSEEEEDLSEEDKRLQAKTKANVERLATQKDKWTFFIRLVRVIKT